ncbi:MAG: hypothetical protein IJJ74_05965 [Eubacterium sp.]|nr:hypothetical protein [Eubacterium sp.]
MMIRYISFVLGTADTNTYYYRTTGETGAYRVVVNKQELFDELGSLHSVDHELLRNQFEEIKQEMEQEKKQEKKNPVKGK